MNNKGFAITTMLYGTFIIFLILMFVMLGLLNNFKNSMDMLIDGNNGARDIVGIKCSDIVRDVDGNGKYSYEEQYTYNKKENKKGTYFLTKPQFENVIKFCGYTLENT